MHHSGTCLRAVPLCKIPHSSADQNACSDLHHKHLAQPSPQYRRPSGAPWGATEIDGAITEGATGSAASQWRSTECETLPTHELRMPSAWTALRTEEAQCRQPISENMWPAAARMDRRGCMQVMQHMTPLTPAPASDTCTAGSRAHGVASAVAGLPFGSRRACTAAENPQRRRLHSGMLASQQTCAAATGSAFPRILPRRPHAAPVARPPEALARQWRAPASAPLTPLSHAPLIASPSAALAQQQARPSAGSAFTGLGGPRGQAAPPPSLRHTMRDWQQHSPPSKPRDGHAVQSSYGALEGVSCQPGKICILRCTGQHKSVHWPVHLDLSTWCKME